MKKIFEFQEIIKYNHKILVDIPDECEDTFDDFADYMASEIEDDYSYDRWNIVQEFAEKFGKDSIEFVEDGSPSVDYEAY